MMPSVRNRTLTSASTNCKERAHAQLGLDDTLDISERDSGLPAPDNLILDARLLKGISIQQITDTESSTQTPNIKRIARHIMYDIKVNWFNNHFLGTVALWVYLTENFFVPPPNYSSQNSL